MSWFWIAYKKKKKKRSRKPSKAKRISCHERKLPIVVGLAVELRISGVAGVCEDAAADTAAEAVLVPGQLAHAHQVSVLDLLAATFADLHDLLALDAGAQFCGNIAMVSSMRFVQHTYKRRNKFECDRGAKLSIEFRQYRIIFWKKWS